MTLTAPRDESTPHGTTGTARRQPTEDPEKRRGRERDAGWLNLMMAFAALWSLGQWIFTPWGRRHNPQFVSVVFNAANIPVSASLVSVLVLFILTRCLLARQRVGLWLFVLFQVLGAYDSLTSLLGRPLLGMAPSWGDRSNFEAGLDILALLAAPVLIGWAWSLRSVYRANRRPGSWAAAASALAVGAVLSVVAAYMVALTGGTQSRGERVEALILRGLGGANRSDRVVLAGISPWAVHVVEWLMGLSMLVAVILFVRTRRDPDRWTAPAEMGIRRLLLENGEDSLGYFATRRDRSSSWLPDGTAAISYRLEAGVCLAAGDPIGPPARWDEAIRHWLATARQYGWVPAVLSCSEQGAKAYARAGLGTITMGDEAVLEPGRFKLTDPDMAPVRHAVAHARRAGLVCTIRRQSRIPQSEVAALAAAAEQWRGKEPERGFSMALGRAGDVTDPQTVWVTVHDGQGELTGLLSFVPWGSDGLSLDLMRRSPSAPGGTNELMVASLMADAGKLGIRRVSLNFCMFRRTFEDASRIGAAPTTRMGGSFLVRMDRYFQLERLYRSNVKYRPVWQPRYLCLGEGATLPQVAVAAMRLEGFAPAIVYWLLPSPPDPTPSEQEARQIATVASQPRPLTMPRGPRRTQQTKARIAHLERLREDGVEGYPAGADLELRPLDAVTGQQWVSGRVVRVRDHGGVVFAQLGQDAAERQLVLDRDTLGRDRLRLFASTIDIGDLLLVQVVPGRSRNGTDSLLVQDWTVAAKSLHPIPFGGLKDPAARTRQRLLDLVVHPDDLALLQARSRAVSSLRATLGERGFSEVETPILGQVQGGANARPFHTHINAYDADLVLRIAPELALKKLLVAGMGPIFELGRNFRNEGADATHNPEFTSLEAYQPFGDYTTMRRLTQALVVAAARAVHGDAVMPVGLDRGGQRLQRIDTEWPVVPVLDAVSRAVGTTVDTTTPVATLHELAAARHVDVPEDASWGRLVEELYGELVEPATETPTFYVDFPEATSPLTRQHRSVPGLAERWDLVANGMELGTAYTELTDPLLQRERLTMQSLLAAAGDPEAMSLDEDFLRALELGMPPAGGLGLGVDRVVMVLTGTTIRQVLPFPFVREL